MSVRPDVPGGEAASLALPTAVVADALVRLGERVRVAPSGLRPVASSMRVAGRVLPAQHVGSVDVFLEAFAGAEPGDVLVVDNGGRHDEACVGDLTALEARASGLAGMLVWGLHRDQTELEGIGFPVFSYGTLPNGPLRLDERPADALELARVGEIELTRDDFVFADADGAVFVPLARRDEVVALGREILATERRQAADVAAGRTLQQQLAFDRYLARRAAEPSYSFRDHLREIGGAIEE